MRSICPYIFIGGYSGPLGRPPTVRLERPSLEYATEIRTAVGPQAEIFARFPEEENWNIKLQDPEASAERWFAEHRHFIQAAAHLNLIYNSYNEVCGLDAQYARHLRRFLSLMHDAGARCGVGDWAVGWPQENAMRAYDGVLQDMNPGDVVTGHIYWDSEQTLRENIRLVHTTPWHMRLFWPGWLDGMVKAVTELGFDFLPDLNRGGAWKSLGITPTQYFNTLRVADDFFSGRDDCIGTHVFGVGAPWDSKWIPFRADEVWPMIVANQRPWTPVWTKYWENTSMAKTIRVKVPNGKIEAMNIETYLRGVVPAEMYASWDMAALEAQAIAARTYALGQVNRHGAEGYDVCSSEHCQVYAPTRVNLRTDEAVASTGGMVLTYEGQIRPTFFSAYCGGITRKDWGAHLKAVLCPCNPDGVTEERAAHANAHWMTRNGVYIKGGHRQGLCQYGAQAMALQGKSTIEILHHYYNMELRHAYGAGAVIGGQRPPEPTPDEKLNILWQDYLERRR